MLPIWTDIHFWLKNQASQCDQYQACKCDQNQASQLYATLIKPQAFTCDQNKASQSSNLCVTNSGRGNCNVKEMTSKILMLWSPQEKCFCMFSLAKPRPCWLRTVAGWSEMTTDTAENRWCELKTDRWTELMIQPRERGHCWVSSTQVFIPF